MRKLYFLYHAESGRLAGMYSELRKAFGREPDPLLEITHEVLGDFKLNWLAAADTLGVPVEYYFRDEIPPALEDFLRQGKITLPAIVGLNAEGQNELACAREDLAACQGKPDVLAEKLKPVLQQHDRS